MRNVLWAHVVNLPVLVGISLTLGGATELPAACTTPGAANARFRGTFGSLDGPFLLPNHERIVDLKGGCTVPSSGQFQQGDVVTLVFTPRTPTARPNVVLVVETCPSDWEKSPLYDRCKRDLAIDDRPLCKPGIVANQSFPATELRFKTPDTPFAGPVKVAVNAASAEHPCGLATAKCAALTGGRACVDDLFEDGSCKTRHPLFPSVTALPPLNNFGDVCTHRSTNKPPRCRDKKDRVLKFATDEYGNILVPMAWGDVLSKVGAPGTACPPSDVICEKRDVDARTAVEAFEGGNTPIQLSKSKDVLISVNLDGQKFTPTEPKFELGPTSSKPYELYLVGDADKKASVLRIARCDPGPDCGKGFFEFRARETPYEGPFVLKAEHGKHGVCDGGLEDGTPCTPGPPSSTGPCGQDISCVSVRGGVK